MNKLATVLAVTTGLVATNALAQDYGYDDGYYGAGIGSDYGAGLGYGGGYGAGLLGGSIDRSLYGAEIGSLYDSEIRGATGEEIGEVQNIIRNCNTYAVVNVDADWLDIGSREVVIPLNQITVVEGGVLVEGMSRNNIDQFPTYRAGIGLSEIGVGEDSGATDVASLYGESEGWGACQQFSGAGGMGAGIGEGIGEGVGAVGEEVTEVGEGVGEGLGEGAGESVGIGGGLQQNMMQITLEALEGADVFGPGERELGRIDRLVRSNNAYVVMNIDTGWFSEGGTAIVPLQRFVRSEEGLLLPGVTEDTIGEYEISEGGVYGGFWNAGYSEINEGYYNTVGDVYGYGE